MKNLLDLRDEKAKKVTIIERIVVAPRSPFREIAKVFFAVCIVFVGIWGMSHADDLFNGGYEQASTNFSVIGTVDSITNTTLVVSNANGSDSKTNTTYELNIKYLEKIETSTYVPLIITDIKQGDKVVAQGVTNGDSFFITRLVSFSVTESVVPIETELDIASSTASTTIPAEVIVEDATTTAPSEADDVDIPVEESASSTPENVATTSDEINLPTEENASSTPGVVGSVVESVVDAVTEVIETVVETVQDIITNNEESAETPVVEENITLE